MNMFEVLTLEEEEKISEILLHFPVRDIHYDPRYLRLFQDFSAQRTLYFHYIGKKGEFLTVFLERILPSLPDAGQERHLISPWYYGGPIYTHATLEEAKDEYKEFLSMLNTYCVEQGIISQFQRLNPALDNFALYGDDPSLQFNRKVVSIDLTKDMETIRSEYDYKVRKNLRRAQSAGLRVVRGTTPDAVDAFIKIYSASMDRKQTGSFYYFNEKFYLDFFKSFPDEAQLFTVYADSQVAGSSLVLGNGKILHDYLRATDPACAATRPSDFVVDAIIEWAKSAGYTQYSLGGGHSALPDDSLLSFKKSFSPILKDYYIYKKVHDHDRYAARAALGGKDISLLEYEAADPFPEYRL